MAESNKKAARETAAEAVVPGTPPVRLPIVVPGLWAAAVCAALHGMIWIADPHTVTWVFLAVLPAAIGTGFMVYRLLPRVPVRGTLPWTLTALSKAVLFAAIWAGLATLVAQTVFEQMVGKPKLMYGLSIPFVGFPEVAIAVFAFGFYTEGRIRLTPGLHEAPRFARPIAPDSHDRKRLPR